MSLSDPMDYSLSSSSIHGIFQARVLEWGAIAFSFMVTHLYNKNIKPFIVIMQECKWEVSKWGRALAWYFLKKKQPWDFPGGPVLKSLPCPAGDMGSIPGWGTKIPHGMEQLSTMMKTWCSQINK